MAGALSEEPGRGTSGFPEGFRARLSVLRSSPSPGTAIARLVAAVNRIEIIPRIAGKWRLADDSVGLVDADDDGSMLCCRFRGQGTVREDNNPVAYGSQSGGRTI